MNKLKEIDKQAHELLRLVEIYKLDVNRNNHEINRLHYELLCFIANVQILEN